MITFKELFGIVIGIIWSWIRRKPTDPFATLLVVLGLLRLKGKDNPAKSNNPNEQSCEETI